MQIIERGILGETSGKLTDEGKEYFQTIINSPSRATIDFDEYTMRKLRQFPPKSTLRMSQGDEHKYYLMLRRDWKRCRVHAIEVKK